MQITTSNHQEAAPQPFLFKLQVIVPRSDPKWRSVPCTPTTLKAQAYDPHPPLAPWATPGFGMQHGDMWRISYWELCELAGFSQYVYTYISCTIYYLSISVLFHTSECKVNKRREKKTSNKKGNNDHGFMTGTMMKGFLEFIQGLTQKLTSTKSPQAFPKLLAQKIRSFMAPQFQVAGSECNSHCLVHSCPFRNPFLRRICALTQKNNGNPWKIHGKWKQPVEIHPFDQEGKSWVCKQIEHVEKLCNGSGSKFFSFFWAPHYPGTVEWHPKSWRTDFFNEGFIFWIPLLDM